MRSSPGVSFGMNLASLQIYWMGVSFPLLEMIRSGTEHINLAADPSTTLPLALAGSIKGSDGGEGGGS